MGKGVEDILHHIGVYEIVFISTSKPPARPSHKFQTLLFAPMFGPVIDEFIFHYSKSGWTRISYRIHPSVIQTFQLLVFLN